MNETIGQDAASPQQIFIFLIVYRWLSLIPPLISFLLITDKALPLVAFCIAVGCNSLISLFPQQLNRGLRKRPFLLAVDLMLMAVLLAITGGERSSYYLYVLNPLFAAAFFLQWRGALLTTTGFLPFYVGSTLVARGLSGDRSDWLRSITAVVGFYLISGIFGYASSLVMKLREARDGLVVAHRDLNVIHALVLSLQSAVYVEDVQERVLEAITNDLGFPRAVIGLVDQEERRITGWLGRSRKGEMLSNSGVPHLLEIPLTSRGGSVADALLTQRVKQTMSYPGMNEGWIQAHFGITDCHIFPMLLRNHPVGVLLVDASEGFTHLAQQQSLEAIIGQAAVAIGTTMLCIYRAQHLAIQDERLRIAHDLHDTVSQSLFGIVYTLDGSLKLLPDHPEEVIPELARALRIAEETHNEVRHSILNMWPSEITAERFKDGLRKYTADVCRADNLQLSIAVNGVFEHLSPQTRRGLYRIAQEALANAAQHSQADQATVALEVNGSGVRLIVVDNGHGFDAERALIRDYDREHFGLRGMQKRAAALGGQCEFQSQIGSGTAVVVDVPIHIAE